MLYSSKALRLFLGLIGFLALLTLTGCMADGPTETDVPWSAPASWEGTMPLPGGYMDRYQ